MIPLSAEHLRNLSPSPLVRRFGAQIIAAANGKPILDVGCGGGRNAVLLAHLGGHVICLDKDLARLEAERSRLADTVFAAAFSRITPLFIDLLHDEWPFAPRSIGGIVNVHFLSINLCQCFTSSIIPGGCLLLETVPGHGGNYRQLPGAGTLRLEFENFFVLKVYRERRVGPNSYGAVTVNMFGTRFNH